MREGGPLLSLQERARLPRGQSRLFPLFPNGLMGGPLGRASAPDTLARLPESRKSSGPQSPS